MAMTSPPSSRSTAPLLGRSGGLLLMLLGGIILMLLFWVTGGHRARLAAEVLGVVIGASVTFTTVGAHRPSPGVITRAYVSLGWHTRLLLVAGMVLFFGFAGLTAVLEHVVPHLRQVPAFGGLVTLVWVLSLTMLAAAGSGLFSLGLGACIARAAPSRRAPSYSGAVLERLLIASNSHDSTALQACFGQGEAVVPLRTAWEAITANPHTTQVLIVRSAAVWGQTWSEWHVVGTDPGDRRSVRRFILALTERGGRIVAGELYEQCTQASSTDVPESGREPATWTRT